MMDSKRRARLRALANGMESIVHIGKDGVVPGVIQQTEEALEARQLVKGTVQQNCPAGAREACRMLAEATGAQPVAVTGRKFILYRRNAKLPGIE